MLGVVVQLDYYRARTFQSTVTAMLVCIGVTIVLFSILPGVQLQTPELRNGVSSCERPSLEDFGSLDSGGSNQGIVAGFFGGGDAGIVDPQTIRIVAVNRVCEASGLTRDSLGSISVIVQYECLDTQCGGMNSVFIDQYRLDCIETNGVASFSGVTIGDIRTAAYGVVGNLTTPLMDQCGRCVLPSGLFMSDPATYCLACDGCVGLGMCLDSSADHCCNYYNGDDCVITCPGGLEPNAQFECDCGVLTPADNSEIVYSNSQYIDSTATMTCDSENGYIRTGYDPVTDFEAATASGVRTCTESTGWDGSAITCSLFSCGTTDVEFLDFGQLTVESTLFGSVVSYICDSGYTLVGDAMRTCTLSGWSGSNPICVFSCGTTDLAPPVNGQMTVESTLFGSVASYSCDPGYYLVGDAMRTCLLGGWNGTNPVCDTPSDVLLPLNTAGVVGMVISLLVVIIVVFTCGLLTGLLVEKKRGKSFPNSASGDPVPMYEEIVLPTQTSIPLNENVSYGHFNS